MQDINQELYPQSMYGKYMLQPIYMCTEKEHCSIVVKCPITCSYCKHLQYVCKFMYVSRLSVYIPK